MSLCIDISVDYTLVKPVTSLFDLKGNERGTILQPMNTNSYSTWLEVDLGAIKRNLQAVKAMTQTEVMAVIKANGYGHGVSAVAEA